MVETELGITGKHQVNQSHLEFNLVKQYWNILVLHKMEVSQNSHGTEFHQQKWHCDRIHMESQKQTIEADQIEVD